MFVYTAQPRCVVYTNPVNTARLQKNRHFGTIARSSLSCNVGCLSLSRCLEYSRDWESSRIRLLCQLLWSLCSFDNWSTRSNSTLKPLRATRLDFESEKTINLVCLLYTRNEIHGKSNCSSDNFSPLSSSCNRHSLDDACTGREAEEVRDRGAAGPITRVSNRGPDLYIRRC